MFSAGAKAGGEPQTTANFEEVAAASATRYLIGSVVMQAFVVVYLLISQMLEFLPSGKVQPLPPLIAGVGFRLLPICFRSRTFQLASLCLIADVALLTSCHPAMQGHVWWVPEHPLLPDVPEEMKAKGGRKREANETEEITRLKKTERVALTFSDAVVKWDKQRKSFSKKGKHDHMLVTYGLHLELWYMVIFVLLRRHAILALFPSIVIFCSAQIYVENENSAIECVSFVFTVFVCLAAKARFEGTQREHFSFIEKQRREIVHQKVLRCEAEFDREQLKDNVVSAMRQVAPGDDMSSSNIPGLRSGSVAGATRMPLAMSRRRAPPSLKSAPAATLDFLNGTNGCGPLRRADCLPPNATVWMEGSSLPQQVCKVVPGQRVLCYDNVGRAPRYVEVHNVQCLAGKADWVNVGLADGSSVTVTANHPMQRDQDSFLSAQVAAADLRPGVDSIIAMRLVPVPVTSIQRSDDFGTRVAFELRQPDRHEVFLDSSGSATEFPSVAVGSAGANASGALRTPPAGLTVKRTFIHIDSQTSEAAELMGGALRRSSSEPLCGFDERAARSTPRENEIVENDLRSARPPSSAARRSASESDLSSNMTPDSADVQIILGFQPQEGEMKVSEFLKARRDGYRSIGSHGHATGDCRPCVFEHKHLQAQAPSCFKGVLCQRCHEPHEHMPARQWRTGSTRRVMKRARESKLAQAQV